MRALELKVPPVAVWLICGGIMWLIRRVLAGAAYALPGAAIVAAGIAIGGFCIAIAGVLAFRRHGTTVDPTDPRKTTAVVRSGIYRFTRNPMYLGLFAMLVAWAVYLQNAAALVILPAFLLYMTELQIKPEERALQDMFGSSYADYKKAVRRWL